MDKHTPLQSLRASVKARPKTAVALLLAFLAVCYFTLANNDGEDYSSSASPTEASSDAGGSVGFESANGFTKDSGYASSGDTPAAPTDSNASVDTAVKNEQEVVTTGSVTLKVSSPVESGEAFSKWVESQGGYVSDLRANTYEDYDGVRTSESTVVIRIEDLSVAVAHLKDMKGEVLEEVITRNDVTAQGADLDARISALRTSITRLTDFLQNTTNYTDLFQVESELTRRQADLDSILAQRKALSDQVQMQTLSVTFTATEKLADPTDKANRGFKDGLRDGWNGVVNFVTDVIYVVATSAPWLIVIAPLGLLGWLVLALYRRRARRRSSPKV